MATVDGWPVDFTEAQREVAERVSKILTPNEQILAIARQSKIALSVRKDSIVATSNRLIMFRPSIVGRMDFTDHMWEDVQNVRLREGILSTEMTATLLDGSIDTLGALDKTQARDVYRVSQQKELEWREKRRVRDLEEARAAAGGVQVMTSGADPNTLTSPGGDAVERLAQAKSMLDRGLITEAEYETQKAKILSGI